MKKRVISLLLTLLILLGTVSCQSGDEIPGDTSAPDLTTPEETEKEMTEMTISDREAPDKVLTLCENGETGYRILYPFGGTYEKEAAEKLASALKSVTGCEFPVVADIWMKENETKVILIGSTASEKTSLLSSSLPELEYAIRVSDESLLIFGKSPKITEFAVDSFLESRLGYKTPSRHESAQVLKIDAGFSLSGSWLESVKGGNLVTYEGDNDSYSRPEGIVPVGGKTGTTGLTKGDTVNVDKSSDRAGGGQFIAKLFTEGLSRAPEGEEYAALSALIAENGCNTETLKALISSVFGSEEYAALHLTAKETVFTVFRAVLNRDPDEKEAEKHAGTDPEALALSLADTEAFASLLPGILEGPYYWTSDSVTGWTGNTVMTGAELQKKLKENAEVSLEPGTLVVLSEALVFPKGCTLTTKGSPDHYAKMARLIRKPGVGENHLVILNDNAKLENIFVDGNFSAWDNRSYGGNGSNVVLQGNGTTLSRCRVSNPVSHGNVIAAMSTEHQVISENLITGYASHHDYTWADGISCLAADSLIKNNHIVDATDAAIAVFRYLNPNQPGTLLRAQNTVTTGNLIANLGNPAYVAYDHETVNYGPDGPDYLGEAAINEDPANMTGCVAFDNRFYTSLTAHYHMVATLSTLPWRTEKGCDRAFGGAFINNYTPEGCFCCCGAGIVADKVTDVTVRGNQFSFLVGEWHSPSTSSTPYAIHASDTAGDLQPGYEDKTVSIFICNLLGGLQLETAKKYPLRSYTLFEEKKQYDASIFESLPN